MAKDFIDFEKLKKLSIGDKDVSLKDKVMKLYEEGGELSAAVLELHGARNVSASAKSNDTEQARLNVLEESCDVINVVIDIINALDFTDEEIAIMFDKKLNKWERKQAIYILNKEDNV